MDDFAGRDTETITGTLRNTMRQKWSVLGFLQKAADRKLRSNQRTQYVPHLQFVSERCCRTQQVSGCIETVDRLYCSNEPITYDQLSGVARSSSLVLRRPATPLGRLPPGYDRRGSSRTAPVAANTAITGITKIAGAVGTPLSSMAMSLAMRAVMMSDRKTR